MQLIDSIHHALPCTTNLYLSSFGNLVIFTNVTENKNKLMLGL
uniref:Uncharacterized protein n=1 Tax=Arundo donax TaxID=35708 RepID=A0A0A9FC79_ARUDO